MWGLGATIGPYVMGTVLTRGAGWNTGYRYISLLQIGLTVLLFVSLPLWHTNKKTVADNDGEETKPLTLRKILAIPGAKAGMVTFFCYCAMGQTTILWVSSYPALHKGVPVDTAAAFASLFCIGITAGWALSGLIANHISVSLLPIYLSVILIVMVIMHEKLLKQV